MIIARPKSEWHEDMGAVLWWSFPVEEPPYVGTPLDCGYGYKVTIAGSDGTDECMTGTIGGWPGYHTHFTPLVIPASPDALCTGCGGIESDHQSNYYCVEYTPEAGT